ncbi:MAG: HDOD domain-containing protein [Phycisphaerales bacterium]|nr:HDOD domain-containing protein [Phycisphaerales bacterium]
MQATASIVQKIRSNPKIPAPSQTVFKILQLTKDPESDIRDVASLISQDAGLTAQLLRQANSALYGCSSPTSSVSDACMRLGFKRIRSAVINQHIVNGLGDARPPGFDAHRYWQSAFAISVAAGDLCKKLLPKSVEEAGTAGLLCDVGIGLLAFGLPHEYQGVLASRSGPSPLPLHEIEKRKLGLTHAEVGAAVLEDWKLGEEIIEAVKHHHADPMNPDLAELSSFARIIAAASTLAEIALEGSDMDRVSCLFAHVDTLSPEADALVNDLLDGLVAHIQQSAESMSIELGSVDEMKTNFEAMVSSLPDVSGRFSHRPMSRDE